MSNKNKKKKEYWRIIVFIISILFIVFLWVKNDIVSIYATMPKEQVVPLIAITILVSLLKIAAITGGVLLIKWVVDKIKKK
jgi:uncharacterized integral membrane protein